MLDAGYWMLDAGWCGTQNTQRNLLKKLLVFCGKGIILHKHTLTKPALMNKLFLIPALLICILLFGFRKKSDSSGETTKTVFKIAVVSDIHYMDPSLLIKDGPAFKKYLVTDGKLLYTSDAIMKELISELLKASPDLVLFAGDMTRMVRASVIQRCQQVSQTID